MDDTNSNGLMDATASRKRRSSILKSQRPPRTPLTELELNVATPTDTTKSRRVSFSRRTGVAEFITDEATNTWKTIYVEQNKSMESSLNDSGKNPARQTVGHLGKRIFEQQFQEEEFVNFGNTIMTSNNAIHAQELNMSLKGNLTQQFAALERDLDEKNLAAPQSNFELSSLTDHKSKIFGDNVTNPILGEMSNKINIDFSSFEPVGASQDKCYDLDEIEKDLLIPRCNAGSRPFGTMTNVSEQIEIDFNVKPVEVRSDELDMSITDTIQNPQVEEVSQSYKSQKNDRKSEMDNDWTLDKENIAINPYVAPKESINFAINEVPDQVLMFDGRRLMVQCEHKDTFDQNREEQDFNKTLLPDDISDRPPQRKTIVLNLNDDLPNFIDVPAAPGLPSVGKNISTSKEGLQRNNINNEFEFSNLNVTANKTELLPNSHKTIIYDSGDIANISVTQAIISNILLEKEKRKTIVFENETGNLSMTQALPTNVVTASKSIPQNKTVLYDVDNISITQAVPMNLLLHNKITTNQNSIATSQNEFDLSFTQAVPHNMLISNKPSDSNKRETIVFDNEKGDISITRILPSNIFISESDMKNQSSNKKTYVQNLTGITKSTLIEDNNCDKLTNNAHSANIRLLSNTTLGDKNVSKDQYDMSESKMHALNIIVNNVTESETPRDRGNEIRLSTISDKFITNMSITESVPNDILLANNPLMAEMQTSNDVNDCDISVTQAVPSNIIFDLKEKFPAQVSVEEPPKNISTINESNNDLNIIRTGEKLSRKSLCQYSNANKTTDYNVIPADSVPTPIISIVSPTEEKQRLDLTVSDNVNDCLQEIAQVSSARGEYSRSYAEMSMTQVLRPNDILHKSNTLSKRGTIVFDNDEMGDISVTQAIPANIILNEIKSNRDSTLLIFQNVNSNQLTSVSESDGMLTKSEETVASKINISYTDIPVPKETILSYNNSLASRTLQQAKEELQKSKAETDDVDMSIDNMQHHDTQHISERNETLLKSMNYIDCADQKFETNSLKSATDHNYQDVFVYQAVTTHNVSKHHGLRTEQGDVTSDKTINKDEENTSIKSNACKESEISLFRHDASKFTDERKNTDFELSKQNNKVSILAELLNMSGESLNMSVDGMDDKNVMVGPESQLALEKLAQDCCDIDKTKMEPEKSIESKSEESNNPSGLKGDIIEPTSFSPDQKEVRSCLLQAENLHRPPLSLSYEQESYPHNKEKILSSDLETKSDHSMEVPESKNKAEDKYLKEADDTKELLEMLTDFTDKTMPSQPERDTNKSTNDILTIQEKTEINDAGDNKESFEKVQNNISAPQPPQEAMEGIESDGNDSNDTIYEEPDEVMYKEMNLRRKSGHVSRDVVKTLTFDESKEEIKCNSNSSPLRKSAPVNVSCAKDSKAKVIPTYLNDVSDGLKSLMQDLVKPTADLMPFETSGVDRINKKSTSTCNKELQTNIITSSQIDIIDINSYPVSESNIILSHREDRHEHVAHQQVAAPVHCDISDTNCNAQDVAKNVFPKPVLVFDHMNPLNNVMLRPTGKMDIHKYSPKKSYQPKPELAPEQNNITTKTSSQISYLEEKFKEALEIQRVSTLYNINTSGVRSDKQVNSSRRETSQEPCDEISNKENFLDTQNGRNPITNAEVNTLIAMKCNKELLQASSSLTLVDDEDDNGIKNKTPVKSTNMQKTSPVKVIFKLNDQEDENVESSIDLSDADCTKAKKRNYNRAKYDQYKVSTPDITPKPLSKMQKLSSSPRRVVENFRTESDKSFNKSNKSFKNEPSKRCPKTNVSNNSKPKIRTATVVQHVTTLCKINTEIKEKPLSPDYIESSSGSTLKTETISHKDLKDCTSTELTSFTSSNAMKEMEYMPSLVAVTGSARSETSDCDDSSVLMNEIESLSFMGSRECEWESCEADSWRFLLLRRRLRLTVRAQRDVTEHAHAQHMRPDTPIINIAIEPVHQESDGIACATLRLACEAMRYECVRSGAGAGAGASSVGALLRRCVGVARAAARWARLMADARAHLAFTLAQCGRIHLTVANFHLRRVWDVTILIELVVEDARELAWPRASHVAVRDVTLGSAGGEGGARGHRAPDVRRLLSRIPHDWGHVPRTIWKVFRHLKNKTEDEDLFWPLHSR